MKKYLITALFFLSSMTAGWMFIPSSVASTPNSILGSHLKLWLDPTDNATITQVAGVVSQIVDKSGASIVFSQATSGKRPSISGSTINGKQVFANTTAANTALTGTLANSLFDNTVCGLIKTSSNAFQNTILTGYVNAGDINFAEDTVTANAISVYVTSIGHFAVGLANTFNTGTVYWACETYNSTASGGTFKTWLNNVNVGTSTSAGTTRVLNKALGWPTDTGWNQSNDCVMGDLIVADVDLSTTGTLMSDLFTNFAKGKWGL